MSIDNNQVLPNTENDEISINLGEIFKVLKSQSILIGIISISFAIVGAIYSLSQPNEYESTVKLLPEIDSKTSGGSLGGLKSLAGLAGVDLGSSNSFDAIKPELYPSVLKSTPFLREALKSHVYVQKRKKWLSVYDYLIVSPELAPIQIFNSKSSDSDEDKNPINMPKEGLSPELIKLNKKEFSALKSLEGRITAEIDKKNGLITITVKLPDPVASATLISFTQNYLTKYVINYRTEKARKELKFLQDRREEAKKAYDNALNRLSTYRDQHRNTFLQVAKDQEKKLQYEVDLAFNLYSSISTQMADAAVKIQKETPVFKVLEPAQIALQKSEPKRSLITIGFAFLGLIISLAIVFFKSVNLKQLLG
ncbi:Wzz/FepE/Etk N-terminal domain-containing protein [Aquirufa rosea]|uniref:Lipopolysaccharide biosynthesis protein n=1 Tax=Aquirufa rosea TaxID=2509241 RepID=A0A4Q1BZW7_9BACT|nr:Wzz/FepE/Etk N-terminal domain-containing protein [Aquirufa rosea]RXK49690.1 lipopolysaccharide biosynthesis protein [Aquirufa rosea]